MDEYIDAKLCGAINIKITEVFGIGKPWRQPITVPRSTICHVMTCTVLQNLASFSQGLTQLRDIHYVLESCAGIIYYDILACTHVFHINLAQNDYTRQ